MSHPATPPSHVAKRSRALPANTQPKCQTSALKGPGLSTPPLRKSVGETCSTDSTDSRIIEMGASGTVSRSSGRKHSRFSGSSRSITKIGDLPSRDPRMPSPMPRRGRGPAG
jgi:hypothetical protein